MPHRTPRPPAPDRPAETPIRAEQFRAALQARSLGLAGLDEAENVRALHLDRGEAILRTPEAEPLPLSGPLMGWFPWAPGMRLELAAGAQGTHLLLGRATLHRAIARSPETAELRFLAGRRLVLRLSPDSGAAVGACFAGILAETLRQGAMTSAVVESFLRILLVQMHRAQVQAPAAQAAAGGGTALAGRFAALVEGHVRDRWTVERYAAELGISRDRLNDICLRVHGRTPGQMVRERLALEARIYLEQSSLAIDQIAGVLGFPGAPPFSRFFSQTVGQPPGRYRKALRGQTGRAEAERRGALYSWP